MADAECFKDYKHSASEKIFYLHNISDVVKEMEEIGFKTIETTEHSIEKKCYYIVGNKQ